MHALSFELQALLFLVVLKLEATLFTVELQALLFAVELQAFLFPSFKLSKF